MELVITAAKPESETITAVCGKCQRDYKPLTHQQHNHNLKPFFII